MLPSQEITFNWKLKLQYDKHVLCNFYALGLSKPCNNTTGITINQKINFDTIIGILPNELNFISLHIIIIDTRQYVFYIILYTRIVLYFRLHFGIFIRTFSIGSLRDETDVSDVEKKKIKKSNCVRIICVPDTAIWLFKCTFTIFSREGKNHLAFTVIHIRWWQTSRFSIVYRNGLYAYIILLYIIQDSKRKIKQ